MSDFAKLHDEAFIQTGQPLSQPQTDDTPPTLAAGGECNLTNPHWTVLCTDACETGKDSCGPKPTKKVCNDTFNCTPFEANHFENMRLTFGIVWMWMLFGRFLVNWFRIIVRFPDLAGYQVLGIFFVLALAPCACCCMHCVTKRPQMLCCDRKCSTGKFAGMTPACFLG